MGRVPLRVFAAFALLLGGTAAAATPEAFAQRAQRVESAAPLRVLIGVHSEVAGSDVGAKASGAIEPRRFAAGQDRAAGLVASLGGRVTVRYAYLPYVAAEVPAAALVDLRASAGFASVTADRLRQPTLLRSAALVGADIAWRAGLTGAGWTVALADTGVDSTHPFLAGKVVAEACYSSTFAGNWTQPATAALCPAGRDQSTAPGSGSACDALLAECEHGTHVAGIVAGRGGPDGLSGIAPEANLIALQVYSRKADGSGIVAWDSDLLQALERVYELSGQYRIAAVNLSLGGEDLYGDQVACDAEHPALKEAVDLLRSAGIATVAAAGNDGATQSLVAPACLSNVISVAATCGSRADATFCPAGIDSIATYSNVAPFLSLLAPGTDITSAIAGNGYEALSGTSMAAPHVSGALALLRQRDRAATVEQALASLRQAAVRSDIASAISAAGELRLLDLRGLRGHVESGRDAGGGAPTRPAANASRTASETARTAAAGGRAPTTAQVPSLRAGGLAGTQSAGGEPAALSSAFGVQQVAVGREHTCVLTGNGAIKCWGNNGLGQLGNGSSEHQPTPKNVSGLGSGVQAIAAGGSHSCALTSGGAVKCWGNNGFGQLGNGSTSHQSTPVDVIGLGSGVQAIAAGGNFGCALTTGGAVKCWGNNSSGQLGNGSAVNQSTPVDVSGLGSNVQAIAAGVLHACALTSGGAVKCWGYNFHGQLGNGSTVNQSTPVDVSGLGSGVQAIAAGESHSCGLTTGGAVKCWGGNVFGQLGNGSTGSASTPVAVSGLGSGVQAIATGGTHSCALNSNGAVKCWGANYFGQLGNGSTSRQSTPVDVTGLASGVQAVAAGGEHSCALTSGGGVKCWGVSNYGQLGNGSTANRTTPVDVIGLGSGVQAIAAGGEHSCALASGGSVKCWGYNFYGQLGNGSTGHQSTPVDVIGLGSNVQAIAAGGEHGCALTSGGAVKCWGNNGSGQLGNGSAGHQSPPVDVSGLGSGVQAIATGGQHSCALTSGGAVKCWGDNDYGQLGNGSMVDQSTPVDVSGLGSGVQAIAAGRYHSCALSVGGAVKCWGGNNFGQLGNGSAGHQSTPVEVSGLGGGVQAIAAGGEHSCALTSGGTVKCWGYNTSGQLGNGSTVNQSTPVDVSGLGSGIQAIATGGTHTCALTGVGAVKCWGYNYFGQLGNGEQYYVPVPVDVIGLGGGAGPGTFTLGHEAPLCERQPPERPAVRLNWSASNGATGYLVLRDGSTVSGLLGGSARSYTDDTDLVAGQTYRYVIEATTGTSVTSSNAVDVAIAANICAQPLSFAPNPLDFEGQSMFTRSLKRQVTISNATGAPLTLNSLLTTGPFAVVSHTCGTLPAALAAGASCTAELSFTPPDEGQFAGSLDAATSAGAASGPLTGTGERSLVTHYYGSILGRYPEPSGKQYWNSEAARVQGLGADLNEVWYALAMGFFNSTEYLGFNRANGEFVDDLYRTFLNREPDTAGRDFWLGQFNAGLTQEVVLVAFMFSPEFRSFTASIFGDTSVRRELDSVMDFYRGLLFRLPDGGGFNFWVSRFRTAQCAGAAAVTAEAEAISGEFARGAEYANRNRTNSEYVGDLYNAILRRGGDGPGVQFWINSIATGVLTREQVRQQFVQSPEFQGRVQQIIAAGCLPP